MSEPRPQREVRGTVVDFDHIAADGAQISIPQRKHKFVLYRELGRSAVKPWLVHRLLGAGEQSAFYGKPGSGKSVLVGDLGLHVAAGTDWHGRKVRQGAVIYFALERRQLVERRAIAFGLKYNLQDLPFAIVGGTWDLRDQRAAGIILEVVRDVEAETGAEVVLIIVDTISRALCGGDENSPKDMGALVSVVGRIQAQIKAHVLLVHHMPSDGSERLRGHGSLLGGMDTTIHVEKLASSHRRAIVAKANDAEEGEQVSFTLESVTIGHDEDGEPTTAPLVVASDNTAGDSTESRLSKNQQTMFSILHDAGANGLTVEQWNERARDAGLGVKRKADLHDFRSALKAKGVVAVYGDRWTVRQ